MLLVILGAGASYDSFPDLPPGSSGSHEAVRPPLANGLFDSRPIFVEAMDDFPEFVGLIPRLRTAYNVEEVLSSIEQEVHVYPKARTELAAIQYYLQSAIWKCQDAWRRVHHGATNHATLVREIEKWRYGTSESVCYVTFNYDTILEEALRQVLQLNILNMGSYIKQPPYSVIKLHGSVNWVREVDRAFEQLRPQQLIDEIDDLRISSRYRLAPGRATTVVENRVIFPALSIPVQRKDHFNCPADHLEHLKELLPKVTRVIVIGWKGAEQDFLNILRRGLSRVPSLMVVSGDERGADETLAAFGLPMSRTGPPLVNSSYVAFSEGFSRLIIQKLDHLEEFLNMGYCIPRVVTVDP